MVIAAYAGTGKTTLANAQPEKFTDFVCMPYKYILDQDGNCGEAGKANPDNIMQDDWPYNYVSAVQSAMQKNKHLLIPTDLSVLMLLQGKGIPYILCYPQRNTKEVYHQRFLDRGNTEQFIDIFIGRWDNYISAFEQDTFGRRVVLRPDEFLCDVVRGIEEVCV